jgi:flagellar biosynthesis anti-sigma factor FlgM
MEIPEKNPLHALSAQNRSVGEPAPSPHGTTGEQGRTAEKDTVRLTERGRAFKAAAEHAHLLPEIREDRVMALKRQLEEGTYRVKGHRVAANLINETLQNNHVLKHIDTKA